MNFPDGQTLVKMIQETFHTTDVTKEQLNYMLAMLTTSSYVLDHHTVKGHPVTFYVHNHNLEHVFGHRPWQIDILNDTSHDLAIMKSRQLGLSEVGLERMLHFADLYSFDKVNCLYTFPTDHQMKDFVRSRVNTQFESVPYYRALVTGINNLDFKKFRNASLFFRTGSKASVVEGIDIDMASLDEFDRMNPGAEASATSSMDSSKYQYLSRWSTPTIPDTGIHKIYMRSDQRVYMHRCDACGKWQELSYLDYDETKSAEERGNIHCIHPEGVDLISMAVRPGSFEFVCKYCGAPLDRWYNGKWVNFVAQLVSND